MNEEARARLRETLGQRASAAREAHVALWRLASPGGDAAQCEAAHERLRETEAAFFDEDLQRNVARLAAADPTATDWGITYLEANPRYLASIWERTAVPRWATMQISSR